MPETPYVETELLLALLNDDEERAKAIVLDMSRVERSDLRAVALHLADWLDPNLWCQGCGEFFGRDPSGLGPKWLGQWHPECRERHKNQQRLVQHTVQQTIRHNHLAEGR